MRKMTSRGHPMKRFVSFLWIVFIGVYLINNTYSRYSGSGQATATAEVAKWAIKITDGANSQEGNFILDFSVNENENVAKDKIAPNTSASARIILDLTGTEVAVDYMASIDEDNISNLFGVSANKVTLTTSVSGTGNGTSGTIALPGGEAFTSSNGKVTIDLNLVWENDEDYNDADTRSRNYSRNFTNTRKFFC